MGLGRFDETTERTLAPSDEPVRPRPSARQDAFDGTGASPRPASFAVSLALAMGVGPLTIYALTALSPLITADLGLGRTGFGSLATMAFIVAAGCSALGGRVIDRVGAPLVLLLLFSGSGLALLMVAAAPSYLWLLLAVAVSGAAQSLSNPVTNRLIATRLVPGRRGLVMGIKQSGVQLMQFAAGATLPALALVLGWRMAVGLMAIVAVVGMGVVRAAVARPATAGAAASRVHSSAPLPDVVWWLTAYAFLVGAGLQATNVYMPLYAFEDVGLTATAAGATTAVMGGVGLLARFGYGRLAERSLQPRPFLLVLATTAALGVTLLMGPAQQFPTLMWAGTAVHGLTALAANVVVMMAVVTLVPQRQVGAATGVLAMGMYVGFAAGPVAFGALVDATDRYVTGWSLVLALYLLAAAMTLFWTRHRPGHRPHAMSSPSEGRSTDADS